MASGRRLPGALGGWAYALGFQFQGGLDSLGVSFPYAEIWDWMVDMF